MSIIIKGTNKVVKPTKYVVYLLMNDGCGGTVLDETSKKIISVTDFSMLQSTASSYIGTDINLREIVPGFWEAINCFGFKVATITQKKISRIN
jgi:hypothetical protein